MSIVVLISGLGLNLQALIDAQAAHQYNGRITHVVLSLPAAYGLQRAHAAGIPTTVHSLKPHIQGTERGSAERAAKREVFNAELAELLVGLAPRLVVCAGWMLILLPSVLDRLAQAHIEIINLHPALPGKFDGTNAIERAYRAGGVGGVMVHHVIAEVDRGDPIVVKEIAISGTLQEYEEKVHAAEHEAIVEAVRVVMG